MTAEHRGESPEQIVIRARSELARELRVRAAAEGTSVQSVIMRGLRELGFAVNEADLQDGRRTRRQRDLVG